MLQEHTYKQRKGVAERVLNGTMGARDSDNLINKCIYIYIICIQYREGAWSHKFYLYIYLLSKIFTKVLIAYD